jgi:hypothetical protein
MRVMMLACASIPGGTMSTQFTPPPMPGYQPHRPRKDHTNSYIIGGAAIAAAMIVAIGISAGESDNSAGPAPAVTVTETETETETVALTDQEIVDRSIEIIESADADIEAGIEPEITIPPIDVAMETEPEEPAGPLTEIGPGTYLVGEDVKAGSYKTAGPTDSMCYWSRNSNDSGELDAIIANDILEGPGRVTLNEGEIFETNGCDTWKLAN